MNSTPAQRKGGGTETGSPVIHLDGTNVNIRLRIVGALGLDLSVPLGDLPVTQLTVGRDETGIYFEVIATGEARPMPLPPTGSLNS